MKKFILIGVAAISILATADVNTKKILEEYRKEALQDQARKEVRVKPEKEANKTIKVTPVTENVEEVVVEEVVEDNTGNVDDSLQNVDAAIEKVNFYLRNFLSFLKVNLLSYVHLLFVKRHWLNMLCNLV